MQIKKGDKVRISARGTTVVGTVVRVNNEPKRDGAVDQWDHWDLEYTIEGPAAYGRWKQFADGGTVEVI